MEVMEEKVVEMLEQVEGLRPEQEMMEILAEVRLVIPLEMEVLE